MKGLYALSIVFLIIGLTFSLSIHSASAQQNISSATSQLDTALIEQVVGAKGATKDGEYKISVPQSDLSVTVDGFRITPPMGLTTWVGFSPMPNGAMVMGDIVLQEAEVGSVEKAVLDHGLSVTAIHNHFIRETPKIMFMHIYGMGSTEGMATAVRAVLDSVKEARYGAPPKETAVQSTLDTNGIESILNHKGEMSGGVFKLVFDRPDVDLKDQGMKVTSFMGFNTWAAFQGTQERAAVAGDFTMLTAEVEPVIKALVQNGIEVVAVHNHMITENPRIFFLHYWGVGPANRLAEGLKVALNQTGGQK